MKVFVLGATGTIGQGIVKAFASNGYRVFGLCRSNEKAKNLLQDEITPVIATAQEVSSWEKYAEESDIIIEALADPKDPNTPFVVQKALLPILQKNKNKLFVYTSGSWIYGDTGKETVTETAPINPATKSKFRNEIEQTYLSVGAIVLRPGYIYGKQGSLTGIWFKAIQDGKVSLSGTGDHFWPMVHVDDLADAYVKAVERFYIARGQIFNIVANNEKVGDCVRAIADLQNYKGEITFYGKASDPFNEALQMSQKLSSQKANFQLNWHPNHRSFVDGVAVYHKSWLSYQQGQ